MLDYANSTSGPASTSLGGAAGLYRRLRNRQGAAPRQALRLLPHAVNERKNPCSAVSTRVLAPQSRHTTSDGTLGLPPSLTIESNPRGRVL
jgi:hypothetical protein